jgi:hypothetical protein
VIGGGDEAFFRIEEMRQFPDGNEARPIEASRARHWQQAGPLANGGESDRMLADVSPGVGIHKILGRHLPARHRRLELLPILSAVNSERREVSGRARLASHPAQGEGALAIVPEHGPVASEL